MCYSFIPDLMFFPVSSSLQRILAPPVISSLVTLALSTERPADMSNHRHFRRTF